MIDHLVLATPDVAATSGEMSRRGLAMVRGGAHVGLGTRNELAGLGGGAYLEVVGPDPDQAEPAHARPFLIDELTTASLLTWCARPARSILDVIGELAVLGVHVDPPTPMSRLRPDGVLLEWRLTMPTLGPSHHGVVPFLIDWLDSPHPTSSLPNGAVLQTLVLTHPDPSLLRAVVDVVGADERVEIAAGVPGLRATVRTSAGVVVTL